VLADVAGLTAADDLAGVHLLPRGTHFGLDAAVGSR
jgi:hypothetical protein